MSFFYFIEVTVPINSNKYCRYDYVLKQNRSEHIDSFSYNQKIIQTEHVLINAITCILLISFTQQADK